MHYRISKQQFLQGRHSFHFTDECIQRIPDPKPGDGHCLSGKRLCRDAHHTIFRQKHILCPLPSPPGTRCVSLQAQNDSEADSKTHGRKKGFSMMASPHLSTPFRDRLRSCSIAHYFTEKDAYILGSFYLFFLNKKQA